MIWQKFKCGIFANFDMCFLNSWAMSRAIDTRGRGRREARVRAGSKIDLRREDVAAENAARRIEEHGISRAVIERDGALRLQR